jgi:hypothetical protein
MSPRRNLKTTGDGTRKGRTAKLSVQEIPNTRLQNCPVNHLCTSRTAGREIDRSSTQGVEENNKRYQENPQLYRTRQINEHIGTIKRQWGYNHTNLTDSKSKWGQFNYAGIQHQTLDQYTGHV